MGTLVEAFTSSSDNPHPFGSCYVALLASEARADRKSPNWPRSVTLNLVHAFFAELRPL